MKQKKLTAGWMPLIVLTFLMMPALCHAGYDYIDITTFLKKIPLAVTQFKSTSGSAIELKSAETSTQMLYDMLEFTGYFKMIDKEAFIEYPHIIGITITELNFKNWRDINAELLITGGITIMQDRVNMELRLFDPFKVKRLIGKKYSAPLPNQNPETIKENVRTIIQRFCSEVIHHLTGNWGVFNSRIAFVSTGTGHKEIYSCDFDGHNPKQITHSNSISLSPAWSSDGNWIAYTDYSRGKPDLYIKNLTEKRGAVVAKEGINITPAWVPGESNLAATLSFSGDPEIYLLTGTGKIIKRLTNEWGIDVSPSFSPDGKKMAFVSKRSGTPQIYIKDLRSGKVTRVTFDGKNNTTPSWSPKGDKIAYSSLENNIFNIYIIGVDGSKPTALTMDSGDNESPTWSPDGNLIAFSSTREGKRRIYVMTAYGTEQRRLLALPGEQTNPKWSLNTNVR